MPFHFHGQDICQVKTIDPNGQAINFKTSETGKSQFSEVRCVKHSGSCTPIKLYCIIFVLVLSSNWRRINSQDASHHSPTVYIKELMVTYYSWSVVLDSTVAVLCNQDDNLPGGYFSDDQGSNPRATNCRLTIYGCHLCCYSLLL